MLLEALSTKQRRISNSVTLSFTGLPSILTSPFLKSINSFPDAKGSLRLTNGTYWERRSKAMIRASNSLGLTGLLVQSSAPESSALIHFEFDSSGINHDLTHGGNVPNRTAKASVQLGGPPHSHHHQVSGLVSDHFQSLVGIITNKQLTMGPAKGAQGSDGLGVPITKTKFCIAGQPAPFSNPE